MCQKMHFCVGNNASKIIQDNWIQIKCVQKSVMIFNLISLQEIFEPSLNVFINSYIFSAFTQMLVS